MKNCLIFLGLIGSLILGFSTKAEARHTKYGAGVVLDDAGTEPQGTFELTIPKVVYSGSPGYYTTSIWLALTYGITDHLEAVIAPEVHDAIWGRDNSGSNHDFGDVVCGIKYQFLEERNNLPSLASKYSLKIPTNTDSKGLTTGEIDHAAYLIVSKGLIGGQLNLNLGYKYVGEPDNKIYSNQVSYGAAYVYPVKKVSLVLELVGKTDYKRPHLTTKENTLDLYGGFKYGFTTSLGMKAALGTRLNQATPDYLAYLACAYYFDIKN
ncbi:transporter [bacterium]|nr:transporter [bacterium]